MEGRHAERPVTTRHPRAAHWEATYDDAGRPEHMTLADGVEAAVSYTAYGQVESVDLTPSASGTHDVITFAYDAMGRKVSTTRPTEGTKTTRYDALGRVVALIDARDDATTPTHAQWFTYDALGRMVTYTDKLGHDVVYSGSRSARSSSAARARFAA